MQSALLCNGRGMTAQLLTYAGEAKFVCVARLQCKVGARAQRRSLGRAELALESALLCREAGVRTPLVHAVGL